MLLQDPTNEDVVPVVKELERKLPTIVTNQGDDPDCVDDIEEDEDDGMWYNASITCILFSNLYDILVVELEKKKVRTLSKLLYPFVKGEHFIKEEYIKMQALSFFFYK